jgi:glyoxylase-like metal-dependent hydrolase (beta-lactamase superfamily II)
MKIHPIDGYIQTTYLIEYPEKLLLFDAACKCDVDLILDKIQSIGKTPRDLKLIAVSHMHPDHSGGAVALSKITGAKIIGSKRANHWYKGISGFITWLVDIYLTLFVARKKGKPYQNVFFPRKIDYDFYFENIPELPYFEDWVAISAKGHTDCDFNFYHQDKKLIYTADNIIQLKNRIIAPYPRYLPDSYKQSLEMYLDLDIEKFLLAHDGIQEISKSEISELIERTSDKTRNHKNSVKSLLKTLVFRKSKK